MATQGERVMGSFGAEAAARARALLERWLVVESFLSVEPSAVHHVRAALISHEPCHAEGLRWLIEQLKTEGQRADYATSVLIALVENGQL